MMLCFCAAIQLASMLECLKSWHGIWGRYTLGLTASFTASQISHSIHSHIIPAETMTVASNIICWCPANRIFLCITWSLSNRAMHARFVDKILSALMLSFLFLLRAFKTAVLWTHPRCAWALSIFLSQHMHKQCYTVDCLHPKLAAHFFGNFCKCRALCWVICFPQLRLQVNSNCSIWSVGATRSEEPTTM